MINGNIFISNEVEKSTELENIAKEIFQISEINEKNIKTVQGKLYLSDETMIVKKFFTCHGSKSLNLYISFDENIKKSFLLYHGEIENIRIFGLVGHYFKYTDFSDPNFLNMSYFNMIQFEILNDSE